MLICPTCNTQFKPTHYNQKYCTRKCRNKMMNSKVSREHARKLSRSSYHNRKSDPNNIKKFILRHAKIRAQRKNIPFNLTENDIVLPTHCPILGVPLSKNNRRYGYSLDKINPNGGYVKENVWIVSQLANAMKWDSTPEERLAFANWVLTSEKGVGTWQS